MIADDDADQGERRRHARAYAAFAADQGVDAAVAEAAMPLVKMTRR
jgi:hypothetical protein